MYTHSIIMNIMCYVHKHGSNLMIAKADDAVSCNLPPLTFIGHVVVVYRRPQVYLFTSL